MRYQKFQPHAELQPFVKCYFIWEGYASELFEVQSPPNVYGGMVFNYKNPYEVSQNGASRSEVPLSFVSGQLTSNYRLFLKGEIGMAGIVFRASALHNFFKLKMSQLVNTRMDLSLLLGDEADSMLQKIRAATSDEERVAVLHDLVYPRIAEAKSRLSIVDEAIEYMDENHGRLSVEDVASHLKISRRYLEKRFLEKVGVSPKLYSRMKRFGALSFRIPKTEKIDWQQIVLEWGFHDQSHLIREFIRFNQLNPSQYHLVNRELSKFVKN